MRARFLHMADCHLGYRQYGRNERFNDFTKAFYAVIDTAVDEKVDFVLLAGDLFQKRAIDALTLNHAMRGLERLHRAGIPCLAVEGNHEQAYYHDAIGWVRFLAERKLLTLLNISFDEGKPVLEPQSGRGEGGYIDILPGLRVYGIRYYGSSTAQVIEQIGAALDERARDGVDYTIFMAHTGIEGVLAGEAGGLTHRQLAPLRPHVDYLALGHVHKPFDFGGWIYNPGSLETLSMTETAWPERGYYLVEVDTDRPRETDEPAHICRLCPCPRREFVRLSFRVDHHTSPAALLDACREYVQRQAADRRGTQAENVAPVVELRLHGVLPFDRSGLDLQLYEEMVEASFSPLLVQVKNATQPAEFAVAADSQLNRRELEQQIIGDLLARDSRFASRPEEWTRLALSLKQLALSGASPEAILDELNSAPSAHTPPQE